MNYIIVPMKNLIYELPIVEPFNADTRYESKIYKIFEDRCAVSKPIMRDWLAHKCKHHDIIILWKD